MRLNVVNYTAATGGGTRFVIQLLRALQADAAHDIAVVSHGAHLALLAEQTAEYGIRCRLLDVPCQWRPDVCEIPAAAIDDCDVAWFPWIHFHRPPLQSARQVVGSFHDALMVTEPTLALSNPPRAAHERETIARWLESSAAIVCSSQASVRTLEGLFSIRADRVRVVPLAADHAAPTAARAAPDPSWRWLDAPFFLTPSNTSPHKNHEALLRGYVLSGAGWPLVLTGAGTDLRDRRPWARRLARRAAAALAWIPPAREATLRRLMTSLSLDGSIKLLGYLPDATYDYVLNRAACVVIPTLGEGGGSFPVEEAVCRGVPVVCSDIPVMREHMGRLGAEVSWFNPARPDQLAEQLRRVTVEYPAVRATAIAQVDQLRPRQWSEVAADYSRVFEQTRANRNADV
jgi:glycosyltransferase involved in cell wall biosynthesis